MSLSAAAFVGTAIGAAVGIASALVVVAAVSEHLRALDRSQTAAERSELERKLVLLRWIVVVVEGIVFATVGFWVGSWLFA